MSQYLQKLILEGEHQQQDFKYCISDSRKIAKSLVAFANTDGGRLLIGVKDNGNIAGVRSEEEYYMVESAAKIFSKPPIDFDTRQHFIENKTVLEVIIESSSNKPHFAKNDQGKWLAYFRKDDENKLANKVMIEVWKKQKRSQGIFLSYSETERFLLDYLEKNGSISQSAFSRKAQITYREAERVLSDFITLGILEIQAEEKNIRYTIADDFDRQEWEADQWH
ncbi:helix-turn-helix domain-containing protein [Sunxiuqinia elliptica]|uniref:Putative DNA-binding protein n=1 Tax=Sunxiuqinia elliptica TaxID=655355 RepID=A0A4R6HA83_9BACT|nr:ATP-binding protein [Sunxiuqinia elliptica]TDO04897.1 putative DNA-binding protein [Sunxiuqinia elliptica]TDO64445.1 putative DNA-binding protein [Sunxiuqinia elliptica]